MKRPPEETIRRIAELMAADVRREEFLVVFRATAVDMGLKEQAEVLIQMAQEASTSVIDSDGRIRQ